MPTAAKWRKSHVVNPSKPAANKANESKKMKARLLEDVKKQEEKRLHPINFDGIIGHEDLKQEILLAVLGKLNEDAESKAYLESIDDHATTGILLYGVPVSAKATYFGH